MRESRQRLSRIVFGLLFAWCSAIGAQADVFSDDFEDGTINASKWAFGGRPTSWQAGDEGSWTWSHEEITSLSDGYLRMNARGPKSGNSYGATPWIRAKYNLNDGKSYVQNFTWNLDIPLRWARLFVQITDEDLPTYADAHWGDGLTSPNNWLNVDSTGTKNLLWSTRGSNYVPGLDYPDYYGGSAKQTWSITTSPTGIARLYDGANGTGSLLGEATLESGHDWYTRIMIYSGTSAGYPVGDASFNLYSFATVPEPSTVALLGVGTMGLLAYAWRRKRTA
jgi:hypothetical protein